MVNKKIKKRKQMRRVIPNVLSICAVIVLVGCVAYLAKDIIGYMRSEQTAADLRELYMSSGSAETFLPTEKPLIPVETDEPAGTAETTAFSEGIITPESTCEIVYKYQEPFMDLYNLNDDLIGCIHANDLIDYSIVSMIIS